MDLVRRYGRRPAACLANRVKLQLRDNGGDGRGVPVIVNKEQCVLDRDPHDQAVVAAALRETLERELHRLALPES